MVSSETRNYVWQGLLDMGRYLRYFGALERRYRKRHHLTQFLLAAAGVGAAAPLIDKVPDSLTTYAGIGIVGLVIWNLVSDYGKKVALLGVAVQRLGRLEIQYRSLWEGLDNQRMNDEQVLERIESLNEAALDAVHGIGIDLDEKLNNECQASTFKTEENRYAV